MRIPVTPVCEKPTKKSGESWIYFQYCYSWAPDLKTLLNSQIAIPPQCWDNRRRCVKENLPARYGNAEQLNEELDRQYTLAINLIKLVKKQGIADIGPFVKEHFSPALNLDDFSLQQFQLSTPYVPEIKKKKEAFFLHLEEYIAAKKKRSAKGSATVYDSMALHLEAFEAHRNEKITFQSLDFNFYESFVDFLTYDYLIPRRRKPMYGLKLNSIGKDH